MIDLDLNDLFHEKMKVLRPYQAENVDCKIKLHANENSFTTPKEIKVLFEKILREVDLNRYPDPDCRGLKTILSKRLGVSSKSLVIGNGSDELIQFLLQIFCGPGETIAFPDPTFSMYSVLAKGMGLQPLPVPLNDNWDFDGNIFLETALRNNAKLIFISYPNNPTGNCFSEKSIKKIIDCFHGIVVLDEAYHDFSRKTFAHLIPNHNNLIILRSLSKVGLAGLRVGFGIAHPRIIEEINKIRLPYNSNSLSQLFCEKALENFPALQTQIDHILAERYRLQNSLKQIDSLTVFPTDSNFILFHLAKNADDAFQKLFENDILIRDLKSHTRLKGFLRVTVGTPEENDAFLTQIRALT